MTLAPKNARAPRAPQFFDVPARTRPAECKGCKSTVYWIVTAAGKRMQVDCDVEGGVRPSTGSGTLGGVEYYAGRGTSHFADCPMADSFRKPRGR